MTTTTSNQPVSPEREKLLREPSPWNLPNILTAMRFVIGCGMFTLMSYKLWLLAFVVFLVACATDWLDGYAARKMGIISTFGRNFDPLVDKMLICGGFICLLPHPLSQTGIWPWMVVVVVSRELLVTSLRGYMESMGVAFGADFPGKVKMFLQCVALGGSLLTLLFDLPKVEMNIWESGLVLARDIVIYSMIAATVYSGLHYLWQSVMKYRRILNP